MGYIISRWGLTPILNHGRLKMEVKVNVENFKNFKKLFDCILKHISLARKSIRISYDLIGKNTVIEIVIPNERCKSDMDGVLNEIERHNRVE